MIAEAAPKSYFEADAPDAWMGWHARVLAWIAQNDVKAYCYINQDWRVMPQWQAACGGWRLGQHARAEAGQRDPRRLAQ